MTLSYAPQFFIPATANGYILRQMSISKTDFLQARNLFEAGLSPRRIAAKLNILPSVIKRQAEQQGWQAGPPANWQQIRREFEQGCSQSELARKHSISISTLRHKSRRENWSRNPVTGLEALRRAVGALENALENAGPADPILTTRISTALSMAAGRLSRVETGTELEATEEETNTETDHQYAIAEFSRLLQDWRQDEDPP